jgi:hypothetical protein
MQDQWAADEEYYQQIAEERDALEEERNILAAALDRVCFRIKLQ